MNTDRRTCPQCNGSGRMELRNQLGDTVMGSCPCPICCMFLNDSQSILSYTKTTLIPDRDPVTDEITNVTLEDLGF